jgi:hypothetical protein
MDFHNQWSNHDHHNYHNVIQVSRLCRFPLPNRSPIHLKDNQQGGKDDHSNLHIQ